MTMMLGASLWGCGRSGHEGVDVEKILPISPSKRAYGSGRVTLQMIARQSGAGSRSVASGVVDQLWIDVVGTQVPVFE